MQTSRMKFRNIAAVAVIVGLLIPPFSQILCTEKCSGGQCETSEIDILCGVDVPGTCCEASCPSEFVTSQVESSAQLASDCQLCACFANNGPRDVIVSKVSGKKQYQDPSNSNSPDLFCLIIRCEKGIPLPNLTLRVHDPPHYYLTHTLQI